MGGRAAARGGVQLLQRLCAPVSSSSSAPARRAVPLSTRRRWCHSGEDNGEGGGGGGGGGGASAAELESAQKNAKVRSAERRPRSIQMESTDSRRLAILYCSDPAAGADEREPSSLSAVPSVSDLFGVDVAPSHRADAAAAAAAAGEHFRGSKQNMERYVWLGRNAAPTSLGSSLWLMAEEDEHRIIDFQCAISGYTSGNDDAPPPPKQRT